MDPISSCRLLLMHEAVFANFPFAMESSSSISPWVHHMNVPAFHTESQASLWLGSFLLGRIIVDALIILGLEVGLLYAAACIEKKVLRYLVRNSCSDTEDFDKFLACNTRWDIYGELLAQILLYQARPLSPSMGFFRETDWEHIRYHGSNKLNVLAKSKEENIKLKMLALCYELRELALSKEGSKKQCLLAKILRLLRGRHMARTLAYTRATLAPSGCFIIALIHQTVHFAYCLHQAVLRSHLIFTVEKALLCALHNLCIAVGIPPKARPAGVSPGSDEPTSMGNYRKTETENTSCSNSRVAKHDVMNAVAKTATTWVVASAATHHATGNRDLLSGFKTLDDTYIQAGNGVTMPVHGRGSVITETVVLPDVWFVPGLTDNIVSASQLIELDYSVGFSRGVCYIRGGTDDAVIGKARVGEDGMFQLEFLKVPLVN